MIPIPTGTVTLLFTDIEGSTRLWEQYPDAMRELLATHDRLMRDAAQKWEGYVFKAVGDGFYIAFATPALGVQAALDAQIALREGDFTLPGGETLRVRMALHTGAVESRDNDYFGPPLNRLSRLLSIAHGGQTILSLATQELVRDHLPPGASLRDLGLHRLRDLTRPEQVFQIDRPGLEAQFAPLRSLSSPTLPNNLPQQTSSFVERPKESREIAERLDRARLLTLVGPGGTGKTRLSLQTAADRLTQNGDAEASGGAWLVEFAPLADGELVTQTVASVLGVREETGRTLAESLIAHLAPRPFLLIFDNCEHLLGPIARLADLLLRRCPRLTVLASSREALNIAGEQTYRVPPLSLPPLAEPVPLPTLEQFEAVRLFIERAQSVRSDFTVTNANAPAIAQICHRLDGIPLALELAATRVRSLPPEIIASRLDDRFRLLTGGSRAALPRQQTLRALLDWSHDLLTDPEQILLRRLSVFAGGWSLDEAEAICAPPDLTGLEDWEVLDTLGALVDKSLVSLDDTGAASRYRYLETVRQYAREKLIEAGEDRALAAAHADFFTGETAAQAARLRGPEQPDALGWFIRSQDNLRAAWDTRAAAPPPDAAAHLNFAAHLSAFWYARGSLQEAQTRLGWVLDSVGGASEPQSRARVLLAQGRIALLQADYDGSEALLRDAFRCFEAAGDPAGMAGALNSIGNARYYRQEYSEAHACFADARERWATLLAALPPGDTDALRDARAGLAACLHSLGNHALRQGEADKADKYFADALNLRQQVGEPLSLAQTLGARGQLARLRGDLTLAQSYTGQALREFHRLGSVWSVIIALNTLAGIARDREDWERATWLRGAVDNLRERHGFPVPPRERDGTDAETADLQARLGPDFTNYWEQGRALGLGAAVEAALGPETE